MTTLGRYMTSLRACGVKPNDRVAVALSGGPDSLALAGMTAWWHALERGQVGEGGEDESDAEQGRSLRAHTTTLPAAAPPRLAACADGPDRRPRSAAGELGGGALGGCTGACSGPAPTCIYSLGDVCNAPFACWPPQRPCCRCTMQAQQLGMQARVLSLDWPEGPPAAAACMAAAREARYAALLRACGEAGRGHLLLAHHADDQAETVLLRLLHASGVLGLACMPRAAQKHTGEALRGAARRGCKGWPFQPPASGELAAASASCRRPMPPRPAPCRVGARGAGAPAAGLPQGRAGAVLPADGAAVRRRPNQRPAVAPAQPHSARHAALANRGRGAGGVGSRGQRQGPSRGEGRRSGRVSRGAGDTFPHGKQPVGQRARWQQA